MTRCVHCYAETKCSEPLVIAQFPLGQKLISYLKVFRNTVTDKMDPWEFVQSPVCSPNLLAKLSIGFQLALSLELANDPSFGQIPEEGEMAARRFIQGEGISDTNSDE